MSTRAHCDCGWLGLCLNDPTTSVKFDPESNSFHFVGKDNSRLRLCYCPMCGGKFPDSSFQIDVPLGPLGEYERLGALVDGLSTFEAVIDRFGKPCYEGLMKTYLNENGKYRIDETITPTKNLEYYELSPWYQVEFYFDNQHSETRVVPKPLNAKQLNEPFAPPQHGSMPIVGELDSELRGNEDD
jgi:hypothetical protein